MVMPRFARTLSFYHSNHVRFVGAFPGSAIRRVVYVVLLWYGGGHGKGTFLQLFFRVYYNTSILHVPARICTLLYTCARFCTPMYVLLHDFARFCTLLHTLQVPVHFCTTVAYSYVFLHVPASAHFCSLAAYTLH